MSFLLAEPCSRSTHPFQFFFAGLLLSSAVKSIFSPPRSRSRVLASVFTPLYHQFFRLGYLGSPTPASPCQVANLAPGKKSKFFNLGFRNFGDSAGLACSGVTPFTPAGRFPLCLLFLPHSFFKGTRLISL